MVLLPAAYLLLVSAHLVDGKAKIGKIFLWRLAVCRIRTYGFLRSNFGCGTDGRAGAQQPVGQQLLYQLVFRQTKSDVSLRIVQRIARILEAGDEA